MIENGNPPRLKGEMKPKTLTTLAIALAFSFSASGSENAPLYDRLGGKPAVTAVVDDFVGRIVADEKVNRWFHHAASSPEHLAAYKQKLADLVCQSTGGPCKYTGLDMVTAHKGRAVTEEAFDRVVSHLVATLEKLNVPAREKGELLGILAPLKKAVVQR